MLSSADYQVAYTKLYSDLRDYIIDLQTAEALAEVEVDTFDSFIDRDKLRNDFRKLEPLVRAVIDEFDDEELEESLEAFKKLVESDDEFYLDIYELQRPEEESEV